MSSLSRYGKTGLVVIITILAAISMNSSSPVRKSLENVGIDLSSADQIVVCSGMTGKKFTIEGNEQVRCFRNMFQNVRLSNPKVLGPHDGYIFAVCLYQEGKEIGNFTFGNHVAIIPLDDGNSMEYRMTENPDDDKIAQEYGLY